MFEIVTSVSLSRSFSNVIILLVKKQTYFSIFFTFYSFLVHFLNHYFDFNIIF